MTVWSTVGRERRIPSLFPFFGGDFYTKYGQYDPVRSRLSIKGGEGGITIHVPLDMLGLSHVTVGRRLLLAIEINPSVNILPVATLSPVYARSIGCISSKRRQVFHGWNILMILPSPSNATVSPSSYATYPKVEREGQGVSWISS